MTRIGVIWNAQIPVGETPGEQPEGEAGALPPGADGVRTHLAQGQDVAPRPMDICCASSRPRGWDLRPATAALRVGDRHRVVPELRT